MKNLITIILLGLIVSYNTCPVGISYGASGADSTVVVSKKHKRVLKIEKHTDKANISRDSAKVELPQPGSKTTQVEAKPKSRFGGIDTFVDKDGDGINDLLEKNDENNALFRFLDEKASSYVEEKPRPSGEPARRGGQSRTIEKEVNTKELPSSQQDAQDKSPVKKTVKLKRASKR